MARKPDSKRMKHTQHDTEESGHALQPLLMRIEQLEERRENWSNISMRLATPSFVRGPALIRRVAITDKSELSAQKKGH